MASSQTPDRIDNAYGAGGLNDLLAKSSNFSPAVIGTVLATVLGLSWAGGGFPPGAGAGAPLSPASGELSEAFKSAKSLRSGQLDAPASTPAGRVVALKISPFLGPTLIAVEPPLPSRTFRSMTASGV